MHPFLRKISFLTRSGDWRLSLLPFIFGCIYLWVWKLQIPLSKDALFLIFLSLLTTIGFASFGYLLNEWFDIAHDFSSGKPNRLSGLSIKVVLALFTASSLLIAVPWLWLPGDYVSWILVGAEILAFVLYSFPVFRFKSIPLVSNIVDMAYAYVLPLWLSFHTYGMYIGFPTYPKWFYFLLSASGIIGFRNILIHQINDVFNDRMAGMSTLPMLLKPVNCSALLLFLLIIEFVLFLLFSLFAADDTNVAFLIPVAYTFYSVYQFIRLIPDSFSAIVIGPFRHLTDLFYQVFFPLCALLLVITTNISWTFLIPVHLLFLVPWHLAHDAKTALVDGFWYVDNYIKLWKRMSLAVNYPIYWAFRLFSVDLIKEKKSALEYLNTRFNNV
jgi:4-hydroxybenzoate polyprenyltransferase